MLKPTISELIIINSVISSVQIVLTLVTIVDAVLGDSQLLSICGEDIVRLSKDSPNSL